MQVFCFLVILTTAFALPYSGLNDGSDQRSFNEGPGMPINPDAFEGDMLGVERMLDGDKNGQRALTFRWPNAVIPYYIDNNIDDLKRQNIWAAFDYYHKYTCIKFVPRTNNDQTYIWIHNGTGCTSFVGRQEPQWQPQRVSLGDGCHNLGVILHELMHAVGFFHEHNRYDRDQYVRIYLDNVQENQKHNFNIRFLNEAIVYHSFDYHSIMIYPSNSFSKNGLNTIVPIQEGMVLVDANYKKEMTANDLYSINTMYNCRV